MKHDNNFNLLRLLAAAQVVCMHSYAHLHLPVWPRLMFVLEQFPGVAVFFVISGFLVSDSCLRSQAGTFFLKRGLRIYPGLIVNIVILEVLMFATGGLVVDSWPKYLALYSQIYFLTASDWMASSFTGVKYVAAFFPGYPSGVLWTLTVELSFYLVLPALLAVVRLSKPIGVAIIGAEMALSFLVAATSDNGVYASRTLLDITIFPYFWVFGLGILARLFWREVSWMFERTAPLWLLAYAVIAVAAIRLFPERAFLEYKLMPGWSELLRVVAMAGVVLSAAFSVPGLTRTLRLDRNDLSYGLYLYHMLMVSTLLGLGLSGQWWLWPLVYGGGLALAAASWFLIERPALNWKRALGRDDLRRRGDVEAKRIEPGIGGRELASKVVG